MMYTNNVSEEHTYQTISSEFQSILSYPASSFTSSYGNPYLTIKNELPDIFRFRYLSEDGSHGGLKPIIELHDCDNPSNIHIKASLYTNEDIPRLHTNILYGNHCDNGVCWMELSEDFTAEFPPLPILIKLRQEKRKILKDRIQEKYKQQGKSISENDLKKKLKIELKEWDINSVKFCFEAFYYKDESSPVCEKMFSKPIKYIKRNEPVGKLNISRLSRCSGKTSGNEDMILLCDKINKDDIENIQIVFYSLDNDGNEDWKENAKFIPGDVHYQVAIFFQTPAYKENVEKDVFIQLRRNSDDATSNAVKFHYEPCHELEPELIVQQTKKRKRLNPPEDGLSIPQTSSSSTEHVKDIGNLDDYCEMKSPLSISLLCTPNENVEFNGDYFFDDVPSLFPPLYSDLLERVSPDGLIDNLASLSIDEKASKVILHQSCSSEKEQEEMLKNSVVELIKETKKDTFFGFFLRLMSFKDENKNNLLHLLVIEGSENLSLLLKVLKCTPNDLINQVNKFHMTPLLIAVSKKQWRIVRILLKFGADPNIKDKNGNNCVHLAAMLNFPLCMKELLASLFGDSTQKYLPDINGLNYDGLAPLHLSIISNSGICTKLLFQANAVVNITDGKCGKTPLHFAYQRSPQLVAFLLEHPQINPDAKDYSGNIPNSYLPRTPTNSSFNMPKLDKIGPKISPESKCSEENESFGCTNENHRINSNEMHHNENNHITKNEDAFCKELNSNGLWRKLGLYVLDDENYLRTIAIMDSNPTKTVLNLLKERHGDNYDEKLKHILDDNELKQYAELLLL